MFILIEGCYHLQVPACFRHSISKEAFLKEDRLSDEYE